MRTLFISLGLAAAAAGLAACAGGPGPNSDTQEYARLEARCKAQGGRFVTTGQMTGRPGLDNACKNFTPLPGGQGGPASSFTPG